MRWHFTVSRPADGPTNMALDEALVRWSARTGNANCRVYGWSTPTLSLGRNQRARDCYDLDAARDRGIGFVRRPTGGRALLHHREVTYSVTMPTADARAASAAYDYVNGVLLDGLSRAGVVASRTSIGTSLPPGLRPCFDAPCAHEIVIGRRKLVGSAQWRHSTSLLQHGSILVRDDQALIPALLRAPGKHVGSPAATLMGALGREPSPQEFAAALRAALSRAVGARIDDMCPDDELQRDAEELNRVYASESWTWRR
jgi:lipoate-protein ligase A